MSHTPWSYRKFAQSDEDLAQIKKMQQGGMDIKPTFLVTNEGQAVVMQGDKRIACVDMHADYKRGERHKTECPERDANARLIAAAPDLLAALEAAADLMEQEDFATLTLVPKLRAAIAKAKGA